MILVAALRFVRILPRPGAKQSDTIRTIFVSHPYSSVGDTVLLLPLLDRIKKVWPDSEIDIVVGSNACDLLEGAEGIRNKFVCGSQQIRIPVLGHYLRLVRHLAFYKKRIAQFRYDLAIAPRWGSIMRTDAIYFAYLSGASQRIGYSSSVDSGDPSMDRLLTQTASGGWHEHETTRNLKLLNRIGIVACNTSPDSVVDRPIPAILKLAKDSDVAPNLRSTTDSAPYAVVSPGATKASRIWPIDRLAQVMRDLRELRGINFLVVGSSSDAVLCDELALLVPDFAISLAGKTNLPQVAQLLAQAVFFIGMDSGIAHVAGAMGVPTVVLNPFPSTFSDEHPGSPVRFRPCGPRVLVLQPLKTLFPCSPACDYSEPHCICQIEATEVVNAILELIG